MDGLDQLPVQYQQLAGVVFAIVVAAGSGLMFLRGRREGAPKPKVQEFYASGGLADMGPVKELVEQQGLLVQQQVKTNVLVGELVGVLKDHFEAQRKAEADRDLEEEIDRRARIAAENIVREREEEQAGRRAPRKAT